MDDHLMNWSELLCRTQNQWPAYWLLPSSLRHWGTSLISTISYCLVSSGRRASPILESQGRPTGTRESFSSACRCMVCWSVVFYGVFWGTSKAGCLFYLDPSSPILLPTSPMAWCIVWKLMLCGDWLQVLVLLVSWVQALRLLRKHCQRTNAAMEPW